MPSQTGSDGSAHPLPLPRRTPGQAPRVPVRAKVRTFTVRVCGPSTDNEETTPMGGLNLPAAATVLMMLQEGDVATIECTESDDV